MSSSNDTSAPAATETTGLLQEPQSFAPDTAPQESKKEGYNAIIAFVCALTICGCANSITLFSMFAPGFQHHLGYSSLQINNISIASALGMYLPVPILGYVADKFGPGVLALFSIVLFTPAYYAASVMADPASLSDAAANYHYLTASFAFIGTGTSALYLSGVITCARVFSKSPGLAISAPVAFYGLSSLWQSQVVQTFFFSDSGDILLDSTFKFFSILYVFTGLLSFIGARIGGVAGPPSPASEQDSKNTDNDFSDVETIGESPEDSIYKRHETVGQFLSDHTAWMLFGAFVLASGPLEMYLNNMGMILNTLPDGPAVVVHVSLFSAFSTIARLSVGVLSDLLKYRVSRCTMLAVVMFVTALIHYLLASGLFTIIDEAKYFTVPSVANGFAYGTLFTLVPTIIACTWGVEKLGTHWGLFILGPAMGSSSFGLLFARVYDAASGTASNLLIDNEPVKSCTGLACYQLTFIVTGTSIFASGLLITLVWHFAWKHPQNATN